MLEMSQIRVSIESGYAYVLNKVVNSESVMNVIVDFTL